MPRLTAGGMVQFPRLEHAREPGGLPVVRLDVEAVVTHRGHRPIIVLVRACRFAWTPIGEREAHAHDGIHEEWFEIAASRASGDGGQLEPDAVDEELAVAKTGSNRVLNGPDAVACGSVRFVSPSNAERSHLTHQLSEMHRKPAFVWCKDSDASWCYPEHFELHEAFAEVEPFALAKARQLAHVKRIVPEDELERGDRSGIDPT